MASELSFFLLGVALTLVGLWILIKPEDSMAFTKWNKKIAGAEYIPTDRTYMLAKIWGVVALIFGLVIILLAAYFQITST